ncbi:MAG: DUF3795 domain-containing protein [Candidatus Bathyarchaeota archaeon]|nr:MAG: DUF3795 domain-containing protein [Candidatus Bathyarchaeota archaeon]
MNRMIAFCGINCSDCKALVATKENDDAKKTAIAEEWKIKPEEVDCHGCIDRSGRHINYWSTCEIRKCGTEKEVENCAHCIDYACEKLGKFHERAPKAKETLEEIRKG